jgi:Immunoglobulin I-set domain
MCVRWHRTQFAAPVSRCGSQKLKIKRGGERKKVEARERARLSNFANDLSVRSFARVQSLCSATAFVPGEMVISSDKYDVQTSSKSMFEVKMVLNIRSLAKTDVGSYRCIAKNSLGEVESSIRLYGAYSFFFISPSCV